jgi:hypothetical protein
MLVRELLTRDLSEVGSYTLIKDRSPAAVVAQLLAQDDAASATEVVAKLLAISDVRRALADGHAAAAGAALVTAHRQREALRVLEARVLDASSLERDL